MSADSPTEHPVDDDLAYVNEQPNPDLVLAVRLQQYFDRFAGGQDGILRVSSLLARQGTKREDLISSVREKVERYLDEDIDLDALEGLIGHIVEFEEGGDGLSSSNDTDEESLRNVEAMLDALPRGHASSYMDGIVRALGSPPSDQVLRSSLLVSLVGELEIYVNQALRACFGKIPSAVDDSKATFSWTEVSSFGSLDEFRERVTDRTVENALYGSLSDWLRFFEKKFKVLANTGFNEAEVNEVFQRRHCIVHYGGFASAQYVQKMKTFGIEAEADVALEVSPEYLAKSADILYEVAMSLGWAITHKLVGDVELRDNVRDTYVNNIYRLLGDRRYGLAKTLSGTLLERELSFDQSLIVRINRWLAFKLDGSFEEVRPEVESFRTNSLSRRFAMARHALLDEHEDAHRIAMAMLAEPDDEFPMSHYLTWPLLREVRRWARENVRDESAHGGAESHANVVGSADSSPRKDES